MPWASPISAPSDQRDDDGHRPGHAVFADHVDEQHAEQRDDRADRKLDAAGHDDEALGDGEQPEQPDQIGRVAEVDRRQEPRVAQIDDRADDDDEDGKPDILFLHGQLASRDRAHGQRQDVVFGEFAALQFAGDPRRPSSRRPGRTRRSPLPCRSRSSGRRRRCRPAPASACRFRPLAPTSMPRVGSSKMITFGFIASHLASTTFCWLPPDSSCAARRTSGVLIARLRRWVSAASIWPARETRMCRVKAGRLGERDVLDHGKSRISPAPCGPRARGRARPQWRRTANAPRAVRRRSAPRRRCGRRRRRRPAPVRSGRRRPARPAPRISPARMSKDAVLVGLAAVRTLRIDSTGAPAGRGRRRIKRFEIAADHHADHRVLA